MVRIWFRLKNDVNNFEKQLSRAINFSHRNIPDSSLKDSISIYLSSCQLNLIKNSYETNET